jgi:hypothetical protein
VQGAQPDLRGYPSVGVSEHSGEDHELQDHPEQEGKEIEDGEGMQVGIHAVGAEF